MSRRASTHNPQSPPEVLSDSISPQVSRSALSSMVHAKQRSPSVNSICSAHSTNQRSMSIVSLESPRNSIVSVEDSFYKPSRTDSNTSLASLGTANSPAEPPREYMLPLRHARVRSKSACAILSDEEFSEPENSSAKYNRWRRRSSDKTQKPTFLSIIKKDFKIRYDTAGKPKSLANAPTSTAPFAASRYDESVSSPLSQTSESFHSPPALSVEHYEPAGSKNIALGPAKKHRSSSVSHNIFLKKRFLLSKDIQFELLGQSPSPTASSPINLETRFPFPALSSPSPVREHSHNSGHHGPTSQGPSLTSPPGSPSPTPLHQLGPPQVPQNKLLQELNRKWNKAMFSASAGDYVQSIMNVPDIYSSRTIRNRKRERSESTSSTDSLTTNCP